MINVIIITAIAYFAYTGFQKGLISQINNMISYIFGFILSKLVFSMFLGYLEFSIVGFDLRNKLAYLILFIVIVYIFKILMNVIENLIYIKWNNKLLGLIFGVINGIMICSLVISIVQDIIPPSLNMHESWQNQSTLYQYLNILQKEYLVQYVGEVNK